VSKSVLTVEEEKQFASILLKLQKTGVIRWAADEVGNPFATITLEAFERGNHCGELAQLRVTNGLSFVDLYIEGNKAAKKLYRAAEAATLVPISE
jgi:hypothetical protein